MSRTALEEPWPERQDKSDGAAAVALGRDEISAYSHSDHQPFLACANLQHDWVSSYNHGINQGPIVLMIENHHSDFLWSLMRQCPYLVKGLRRAGFTGGWLA